MKKRKLEAIIKKEGIDIEGPAKEIRHAKDESEARKLYQSWRTDQMVKIHSLSKSYPGMSEEIGHIRILYQEREEELLAIIKLRYQDDEVPPEELVLRYSRRRKR